jgi:DNA-binding response OmpR family regulator
LIIDVETEQQEAGMIILVIDDDPAMTELLKVLLSTTNAVVHTANSGKDGIDLAQKLKPDLIVLDLMMPEIDGWEVCKRVRVFSAVPILILSALDNPGMVAAALDAGADDYLIKPVSSGMLFAHINNLVRRSKTIQALTQAATI